VTYDERRAERGMFVGLNGSDGLAVHQIDMVGFGGVMTVHALVIRCGHNHTIVGFASARQDWQICRALDGVWLSLICCWTCK